MLEQLGTAREEVVRLGRDNDLQARNLAQAEARSRELATELQEQSEDVMAQAQVGRSRDCSSLFAGPCVGQALTLASPPSVLFPGASCPLTVSQRDNRLRQLEEENLALRRRVDDDAVIQAELDQTKQRLAQAQASNSQSSLDKVTIHSPSPLGALTRLSG